MKDEPVIRSMRSEDWNELHQFDADIFPDDMLLQEWFEKRVQREGFFALEVGGRLVGNLIVALYGEKEGHLGRIGVARNHQGKGLGCMLMEKALDWFREKENIHTIYLYTQHDNYTAQGLYTRYGFQKVGTTWHYYIPYDSLKPLGQFSCETIRPEEIDFVGEKYRTSLPPTQIRRFLEHGESLVFTLKDSQNNVVGVCRFTPSFPGCFPFEIDHVDLVDDFISCIKSHALPEYDYIRLTFTDNPELAQLCEERGYRLHHRLFKMGLKL